MHTNLTMDIRFSGNVTGNHLPSKHSVTSRRTGLLDYIDVGTSNSKVKHVLCTFFFPLKIEDYDWRGRGYLGKYCTFIKLFSISLVFYHHSPDLPHSQFLAVTSPCT